MSSEIEDPLDNIKAGARATANKASGLSRDRDRKYDKEKFKGKAD
jgi:hypothetical protein